MIDSYKPQLMRNWGEKADCLDCYCEVKFIDEYSDWACYIYAINPEDEDTIECIILDSDVGLYTWSLKELYLSYNTQGDHPIIDQEFRKIHACVLYNKLSRLYES